MRKSGECAAVLLADEPNVTEGRKACSVFENSEVMRKNSAAMEKAESDLFEKKHFAGRNKEDSVSVLMVSPPTVEFGWKLQLIVPVEADL
jgi:hypothetical protein